MKFAIATALTLVQNRASYEVDFYLPEMVKGYRQRYGQPPLTEYRGNDQRHAEGFEGSRTSSRS